MCTRISVFVPTTANLDGLASWADDCGVGVEPVTGAEGQWHGTSILVTRSYCDCGTPIGSLTRSRPRHDPDRTVRALRNRGWTEAKITRSLAQKKNAKQRKDAREAANAVSALADWVTFFKGAPTHARLVSIGVFYREDGRCLSTRDLRDAPRETSALAALEPRLLARLQEGVLHQFSTSR